MKVSGVDFFDFTPKPGGSTSKSLRDIEGEGCEIVLLGELVWARDKRTGAIAAYSVRAIARIIPADEPAIVWQAVLDADSRARRAKEKSDAAA